MIRVRLITIRRLNKKKYPGRNSLPRIHYLIVKDMAGSWKIDLVNAYNQIHIATEDIPETAVVTLFDLYRIFRMPVGLRNAAHNFRRLISSSVSGPCLRTTPKTWHSYKNSELLNRHRVFEFSRTRY